jgi:phage-related protein
VSGLKCIVVEENGRSRRWKRPAMMRVDTKNRVRRVRFGGGMVVVLLVETAGLELESGRRGG